MANNKKSKGTFRYVIFPGALILIVIVILNIFVYKLELRFYSNVYNNEVAGIKSLISRRFQTALVATESTRAFFVSSENVTKDEFDLFASVLTENIASGAITIPAMVEWVDAKNVIQYVYPLSDESSQVVGLDLNEYPNRLLPIIKAKTTRAPVVSEPIMFVEGYPGILIYSPIFKGSKYLGQIIVAVRLANLLAPVPGENTIYQKDLYIQTGNFIISFDDDLILNNNGERVINAEGDLVKDSIYEEYSVSKKGVVSQDMVFADKTWQLKFSPTYLAEVNKRVVAYAGFSLMFLLNIVFLLWILQKRQEKLAREKAKTEALVHSIGDGLLGFDKNTVINFVNKKAEELSGFKAEDAVGKSYYDFWKLVDKKGVVIPQSERPFHKAILKKEVIDIPMTEHFYLLKKDGTRFPFASTIAPIIINGEVEGSIMSFRDVTKESEVDRMKTEFLSLASHQLLTPSTSVKWISELLLKGEFGELKKKQLEHIKNIYNSNESIISLVNSLLNVSRIESGRIVIEPKPIDLNNLVEELLLELKNKIKSKEQLFSLKSEKELPKINIDPHLIKEVYKNLLTNAIKYTPVKGNISVDISKVKNDIVSKVSDNGYGIPAEDKKRVFEKFYRGENITGIEKDGNGLGLYLVKQIIEVSGGKIWFESEIGKGTTFFFSLPLSGSKAKAGEVTIT